MQLVKSPKTSNELVPNHKFVIGHWLEKNNLKLSYIFTLKNVLKAGAFHRSVQP